MGPRRDPGPIPPIERAKIDGRLPIEAVHRRAPRYGRFIGTGLLAGALLAFIIALVTSGWSALSTSNTFWLLLISLGFVGVLAGAGTAYWLDQASLKEQDDELEGT